MLIVRHGESHWNVEHRWQGWIDIALTERGEAQARARGRALADAGHTFAAVASSDLVRAHRTAELLAEALAVEAHLVDAGFRERFGGEWQGLTQTEINERYPAERAAWMSGEMPTPPGGETLETMLERFDRALHTLHTDAPAGPLLIVSHGGISRAVARRAGAEVEGVSGNLGGRWYTYRDGLLHAGDELPELTAVPLDGVE